MRVRFGEFVFDSDRRELRRGDRPVHLTPKSFRLLEVLLEARPRAVSKRDLYDQLWPGTFVVEANLKVLVSELRRALEDDSSEPSWLRTVYGFGYSFAEGVVELPPTSELLPSAALFTLQAGPRRVTLRPGENLIGRELDGTVVIDSPGVSRRHARITVTGDSAVLEDLGSKNGTRVAGRRIEGMHTLTDGDEIRVGGEFLIFRAERREQQTKTEPSDD